VKILIVDDYKPFAQSLKVMLKPAHDVHVVGSGAEAFAAFARESFDTAFVDLRLPDTNGLDVCRRIVEEGIHLPKGVVIITGGGANPTLWAELTRLGVKFIEKPFTPEQLFALIAPA
jgi:DNA-binding NtrC family response regulator